MSAQSDHLYSSSLGTLSCQRNSPVFSSKHMSTPRSSVMRGSRGTWLLVPTSTRPSAITGVPWVCLPRRATHLTFLVVLRSILPVAGSICPGSNHSGRFFSDETLFRVPYSPHCG